ncbi:glycosyltransferase family 4 protein [Butyrivibrio sp. YAB3001]|uniref:glycosyltransferase family 4 protein n=1 Tax=Butyrivibrio sp. YAB3001 TaxID=1520812 RepID=UPI0008F670E8|nr:glycosyltransferase family 4 protein [Butyrivibrio sp. YAB3001]SFC78583.1 Glycosyltransferase involved in cell wall bisynthesis [Butyrivibrio sp. YAB3001]
MGDRHKILMVGPDRNVHGGISAVVNEMYQAGLDKKVELKYIGTMQEGSKLKKLLIAVVSYIHFLNVLDNYDIVHVHFASDSSFVRKSHFIKAAYRKKKKIVLHQHGGDFKNYYENELSDNGRKYVQRILQMGDKMLVLTESWKLFFSNIINPQDIIVFPNGISVSNTLKHNELNITLKKDMNKILFLGRICKDKGIDELLLAMDHIHDVKSQAHLYIGGIYEDMMYQEKIEARSSYVTYLGWVTGELKEKYLDECGILVLPSYYEGFGLSIIEAMLHECAVVASNVGGIPEIIDDRENGILVEAKDSDLLKAALEDLMNDKDFASKLGAAGRKKVLEKYSVDKNIRKLLEIYNNLRV